MSGDIGVSTRSSRNEKGAGAFDALATSYDEWYETPLGRLVDRLEKEAVFGLMEAKSGALALDLSCGTGNYALELSGRSLRVVGVDLSEPMLRLAQAKTPRERSGLHFVRAEGSELPFRDGAFDLITIILGLEFAANPGKTLGEAHRVLKPGASVIVAILNRRGLWTLWRRLKRLFLRSVWRQARFLSREKLRRLMEEGGFRHLRCREAVHFLPICRGRAVRYLERWETLGARLVTGLATFLAVAGRRT